MKTRTQYVQTVIFLQGDDADEVLRIIYPHWEALSGSIGWATRESLNAALEHLRQWDCGEPTETRAYTPTGNDEHRTRDYIMCWHFGLGWVSLERKVKKGQ